MASAHPPASSSLFTPHRPAATDKLSTPTAAVELTAQVKKPDEESPAMMSENKKEIAEDYDDTKTIDARRGGGESGVGGDFVLQVASTESGDDEGGKGSGGRLNDMSSPSGGVRRGLPAAAGGAAKARRRGSGGGGVLEREQGTAREGTGSSNDNNDTKTLAVRIGDLFSKLPLSKLKIVIGT